jgi:GntR family transcriptional regulator
MFLSVDPHSGLPLYRQIMDQVRRMIVAGRLVPGDRLPSVRDLAVTLQINPLTVGKAYGELEREGTVEMRRGLGMFVRPLRARSSGAGDDVPASVEQAAQRFVLEAAQAGLTRSRTLQVTQQTWRDLLSNHPKKAEGES